MNAVQKVCFQRIIGGSTYFGTMKKDENALPPSGMGGAPKFSEKVRFSTPPPLPSCRPTEKLVVHDVRSCL